MKLQQPDLYQTTLVKLRFLTLTENIQNAHWIMEAL